MTGYPVPPEDESSAGSVTISGSIDANEVELAGIAVDVNSGSKSAGTQRVVLATDQPQLTNALKVDGSAVIQPVSATSLPLPTGAATSAKQAAVGTAGTPSVDVLSVQGVASMTALKVDASATIQPISGIVSVNAGTNLNTSALALDATLTGGTQQTKVTDGTTVASNLSGDTGQNAQVVVGSRKEVVFTTTTAQAVAVTDVSNYRSVSVHIVSQGGSSSVAFQVSNDNTNWVSQTLQQSSYATNTSGLGSTTGSGNIFSGPITARYFRLNVTGIVSGTTAGVVEFFAVTTSLPTSAISSASFTGAAVPSTTHSIGIQDSSDLLRGVFSTAKMGDANNGQNSVSIGSILFNSATYDRARAVVNGQNSSGTGVAASGILGQFDDVSPGAVTENNFAPLRISSARELYVHQRPVIGTDLVNTATRITTNTTTTLTAATAYIASIVVTVSVAGTTSTITIQDKQGTPLALVSAMVTTTAIGGNTIYTFDTPIKMTSGIDIVTAGAAAATVNVFINYYQ